MTTTPSVPDFPTIALDACQKPDGSGERKRPRRSDRRLATTVACYSVLDRFFPTCDMLDYTEGFYAGDPNTPYDVAQHNQINYVLDEVECGQGTRVLDIGCGNGSLLDEVKRRGGRGVGVTISPEQVRLCRRRGLDVHLLNYCDLDDRSQQFDTVIANGSMEHFVQAPQAVAGDDDEIYRQFFRIAHSQIDPASTNRRFINTTIHFARRPDPANLLRNPADFPKGSDNFHFAMVAHSFGGWYPVEGQLERCAAGYFEPIRMTDGTYDYHLTSEHWLRRIRQALTSTEALRVFRRALPLVLSHPVQLTRMVNCMLISESWNWQFRPPDPPTRLLRQTWRAVACSDTADS